MFTLHQASTQCRNMMNYLMCFFCAPDQYLWYIKKYTIEVFFLFILIKIISFRRVKICQTFCDELYEHCKTAEFSGNIIGMFSYLFFSRY